jgi:hypothetical protein
MNNTNVYNFINDYFEHPIVTKIGYNESSSLYVCSIPSMINNEYKYLLFEVQFDVWPIGHTDKLKNVRWTRMQSKKFDKPKFRTKKEHYYAVDLDNSEFTIKVYNRSDESCDYIVNNVLNCNVNIENSKSKYDHVSNMNLTAALEIYSTTVQLN